MDQTKRDILASRVMAGAMLLDEKEPGWAWLVDIPNLEMGLCSRCVLGQVFRSYSHGLDILGLSRDDDDHLNFGFDETTQGQPDVFDELGVLWAEQVRARTTTP